MSAKAKAVVSAWRALTVVYTEQNAITLERALDALIEPKGGDAEAIVDALDAYIRSGRPENRSALIGMFEPKGSDVEKPMRVPLGTLSAYEGPSPTAALDEARRLLAEPRQVVIEHASEDMRVLYRVYVDNPGDWITRRDAWLAAHPERKA